MRFALFGATGATGKLLLGKALAAGHQVTAYVRNPAKLGEPRRGLAVVVGELTDADAIDKAIAGQDAVISLLGPVGKSVGTPVADGTRIIVAAMHRHGVRRLIATATPSATDPGDGFRLSFWLAVRMIKVLAGSSYADIVATADAVRSSSLDWTLARLPMLSDVPTARPAAAGYIGDRRIKLFSLSRPALADFLLDQLGDRNWIHKAPALSNASDRQEAHSPRRG
jgi:nucleoside-diphosphate-sugar epimerase